MISQVADEELIAIAEKLSLSFPTVRASHIRTTLLSRNIDLDESTIRGRFIGMKRPLSTFNKVAEPVVEPTPTPVINTQDLNQDLGSFILPAEEFKSYIERPIDKRLAIHYNTKRHPITQGKQGTGKTESHKYYAYKSRLPFFLFSCYEDMKLSKLFGDKTFVDNSIVFREGVFVKAIQSPSVILFDEINAISNSNSFDFHALLQNRELFIKDADNGNGKVYKIHPECRIGFSQNPKSNKYIGGNIKPSSFLGRCTYLTYPEFTRDELTSIVRKHFTLQKKEEKLFIDFYEACVNCIDKAQIPVDISIRQLINTITFYKNGMSLSDSLYDGTICILDSVSQPKTKEAFWRIAQTLWEDLCVPSNTEKVMNVEGVA